MKTFFMISFAAATVVEIIVVAVLVYQLARQRPNTGHTRLVVRPTDILTAGAIFGGVMTITALTAHGWSSLNSNDILLYAATFGIVTAALVERLHGRPLANAAYALPTGFGLVAGLVGSTL